MDHLSSTTLMCAILLLFYASGTVNGGVALDATCTTTSGNLECTITNADCRDEGDGLKCLCKTAYYKSSTDCLARKSLDATCASGGITDQCTTTNAMCRDDSGTVKCLCKTTHYRSGSDCLARKKPDEGCATNQCVANGVCNSDDNKCDCNAGYIATPTSTPNTCAIVAFGDSCTTDSDCGEDNNVCSSSKCACSSTSSRNAAGNACVISSDAATIMLAHMHVFIFGTVASLYFLV